MKIVMLALTGSLLSACATQHPLAQCHGNLVVMNADKWQPTASEIEVLDKLCPEEK